MNPTLSGIIALFIFSIGTILVALSGDIPPFQLSFLMFFSGTITIWFYFRKAGTDFRGKLKAPISQYMVMFLGVGIYSILLNIAFKTAPAFEINMLNYLWPILLVLFAKLLKKQCLRATELLGMILGFVGMCVIFMPQDEALFAHVGTGHVLIILAAVVWAFYSAFVSEKHYSVVLLIPVMAFSGCVSFVLHVLFEQTIWVQSASVWIAVLVLCLTRFCFALWDYGMRKGDQMLLNSLSYFLPLLSSLYFIAFGLTPARAGVAIGGALIVAGCVIVNIHHLKRLMKR